MDSTNTEPATPAASGTRKRRDRLVIGGAVTLAVVLTGGLAAFAFAGGGGYNEAEYRADVEAASDLPVGDWTLYLIAAKSTCEFSPTALSSLVRTVGDTDPRSFTLMRVDFQHLCPERSDELESRISTDQIRRAMGGPGL